MSNECIDYKRLYFTLYDGINKVTAGEIRSALDKYPLSLFEIDENGDFTPSALQIAKFERDNNSDIMPQDIFQIEDRDFELDENGDIMPKEV